jgi:hypothetical protein
MSKSDIARPIVVDVYFCPRVYLLRIEDDAPGVGPDWYALIGGDASVRRGLRHHQHHP